MTKSEITAAADSFNDDARELEARLEELARDICSVPGSGRSWNELNNALDHLRVAIRESRIMYMAAE